MLQSLNSIRADPDALMRSHLALSEIKRRGIGKPRPCILSRLAIPGVRAGEVYFMGTLEGKPIDADGVSELLQAFATPIFPNHGLPGATHYHTTPAWPHDCQWAIGFPVKVDYTELQRLTHWRFQGGKYPVDPPGTVYTIGRDMLQSFRNHCIDTFDAWQLQCDTDREFAKGCEERWRNQEATLSKISLSPFKGAASGSTASIASAQSQRVSRPPSLHTVHENSGQAVAKHAWGGEKNRSPLQDSNVQHCESDAQERQRRNSVAGGCSVHSTTTKGSKASGVSKSSRKSKWRMGILKSNQRSMQIETRPSGEDHRWK